MISVSALAILVGAALLMSAGAVMLLLYLLVTDIRKEELW